MTPEEESKLYKKIVAILVVIIIAIIYYYKKAPDTVNECPVCHCNEENYKRQLEMRKPWYFHAYYVQQYILSEFYKTPNSEYLINQLIGNNYNFITLLNKYHFTVFDPIKNPTRWLFDEHIRRLSKYVIALRDNVDVQKAQYDIYQNIQVLAGKLKEINPIFTPEYMNGYVFMIGNIIKAMIDKKDIQQSFANYLNKSIEISDNLI